MTWGCVLDEQSCRAHQFHAIHVPRIPTADDALQLPDLFGDFQIPVRNFSPERTSRFFDLWFHIPFQVGWDVPCAAERRLRWRPFWGKIPPIPESVERRRDQQPIEPALPAN
jgi:hypothetical protein